MGTSQDLHVTLLYLDVGVHSSREITLLFSDPSQVLVDEELEFQQRAALNRPPVCQGLLSLGNKSSAVCTVDNFPYVT